MQGVSAGMQNHIISALKFISCWIITVEKRSITHDSLSSSLLEVIVSLNILEHIFAINS